MNSDEQIVNEEGSATAPSLSDLTKDWKVRTVKKPVDLEVMESIMNGVDDRIEHIKTLYKGVQSRLVHALENKAEQRHIDILQRRAECLRDYLQGKAPMVWHAHDDNSLYKVVVVRVEPYRGELQIRKTPHCEEILATRFVAIDHDARLGVTNADADRYIAVAMELIEKLEKPVSEGDDQVHQTDDDIA
jgi:hypothetical protein